MSIIRARRGIFIVTAIAAAAGLTAGLLLRTGSTAVFNEEEQIPLVAVMYHSFSKDMSKCGDYVIPPELFENDIKYLIAEGFSFVDTRDITDYCKNDTPLPPKPVMITIDDGHYSVYEYIFPIMKKYKAKAVIAPIAVECDRYSESMELNPSYSNMCWDNIKEMYDSGLADIQNHSYDMHHINSRVRGCAKLRGEATEQYRTRLYADLKKADDAIFNATGARPIAMIYPFGLTSKEAREVIDRLGYTVTVSCTEGASMITREEKSLHMIKRYNRAYGKGSETFFRPITETDRLSEQ
ncbi:MAG: polysaccharide deacetylase family protein [Clostridia bacterium]|nr:polysaccharide deacetylase family protein [Clostridia bacterium]